MRIHEILVERKMIGHIPMVDSPGQAVPGKKAKPIGIGAQASAYELPNQPGSIIKYVQVENLKDAHLKFTNLILAHQDNPFFPRIYNAKLIRNLDSSGDEEYNEYQLIVQMEKLKHLNTEELDGKLFLGQLGFPKDERFGYDLEILMNNFNGPKSRKKLAARTKNPKFKEALELLEPYFKYYGSDLHDDNVMARLTSIGPQLVIVDPISNFH